MGDEWWWVQVEVPFIQPAVQAARIEFENKKPRFVWLAGYEDPLFPKDVTLIERMVAPKARIPDHAWVSRFDIASRGRG